MDPAALGLTCKDALLIFSQNETLRLQKENNKLQKENDKLRARREWYIPTPRIFKTRAEYLKVEEQSMNFLSHWIRVGFNACNPISFALGNGLADICDIMDFHQAITDAIHMILDNEGFSYNLAGHCLDIATAAVEAADYMHTTSTWCRDQELVAEIVSRSLIPDKIPELIRDFVEFPWPDDY